MKREDVMARNASISARLSYLPRKMLTIPGHDQLPLFVLHELCHEGCFDLAKAAYLVDNPDFDCMKGVAGLAREHMVNECALWDNQGSLISCVAESPFNLSVRKVVMQSARRNNASSEAVAHKVCEQLGMRCDGYCSWEMKHANHGLLVFERGKKESALAQEDLLNGVSLLSFCPIL
jgi:hypothetical protein